MSEQSRDRGHTTPGDGSTTSDGSGGDGSMANPQASDEARLAQAQQEWAEESEEDETTPAGAYPIGKAMTGGLVNDELPDGGTDDITG